MDQQSISKLQTKLAELVKARHDEAWPIYLVLDSPGGDVEPGLSFIDYAQTIPNLKTISIFAASMASGIVEAMPGERLIVPRGTLMFHRAAGQVGGTFDGELESRLAYIKKRLAVLDEANASRLKLSVKEYKEKIVREWWIDGSDAIGLHAADKVVQIDCSQELIDSQTVQEINLFIFTLKVTYSNCPLFRYPVSVEKPE